MKRRVVPAMWLALALATWLLGGMVLAPSAVHAASQAAAPANVERFVIVPLASEALYRVGETFFNRNNQFKIAIGTTHAVQGEILVDRAHPRRPG